MLELQEENLPLLLDVNDLKLKNEGIHPCAYTGFYINTSSTAALVILDSAADVIVFVIVTLI